MSDQENDEVEVDEIKTEFRYVLASTFQYSKEGEQTNAKFIALTAPTSKCMRECAALKQAFFRAIDDQKDAKAARGDVDTDLEITGEDILSMLSMSKTVDLPDLLDTAKQLFLMPGIALIDGEHKLKTTLIERMHIDDFQNMFGEYMVNFILASSLKLLKEKSSKA